jgi:hypothetical protein
MSSASTPPAVALTWPERRGLIALAGLAFATLFLFATRGEPVRVNWGDPWSDCNAMTSGRYFVEDGFVRTALTPILDVGPLDAGSLRYTHYPPLPDLVNGVERALFGFDSIAQFRVLAALASLAALVLFWRFVRRISPGGTADYAVALVATNLIWLQYADTLHHVPLYMATGYLALERASVWLGERRRHQLVTAAVASTLCALASYDFVFFLPIMTAMTVWLRGGRLRDRAVRSILLAVVGGLVAAAAIKLALVAWAVGPREMVRDVLFQFQERATDRHSTNYKLGIFPVVLGRAIRFFSPLYLVLVPAMLWSLWRWRHDGRAPLPLVPLAFLAAGLPFCLVFTQLVVEQYHPTLQLLPFHAVGMATVIVALRGHRAAIARAAGLALFAVLLGWQLRELARFPKVVVGEGDLRAVGAHLAEVDQRRFVLSNLLVDGPVRYYWRRHLMIVPQANATELDRTLRDLFSTYGTAPIRFVEYTRAADAAFDKLLMAYQATRRRWEWIGFPVGTRRQWQRRITATTDELMELVRHRAVLEYENPTFRVYRFDASAGDRGWAVAGDGDATAVDLGGPEAIRHKLHGFAASAPAQGGVPAAAIVGHDDHAVRFTLRGLVDVPTGTVTVRAAVQLHVVPADGATVRVRVAGPRGATIALACNGVELGRAPLAGSWQDVELAVPAAAFAPDRRLADAAAPDVVAITVDGAGPGAVQVATVAAIVP